MELYQLRYFLAVAEHLSFTRAARALNLSQPPLSQQIRRLEADLGGDLFVRDTHSVRLSDLGAAFVPMARRILGEVSAAKAEIGAMTRLEKGRLRVGASGALAYYLLPQLLWRFRSEHPGVAVEIVERRTSELIGLCESDELDLALVRLPHEKTALETRLLAHEPLMLALPPGHRLAAAAEVPISALAGEPLILIAQPGEPFHALVTGLCTAAGFAPDIVCSGATYATAARLVGMGMGVTVLSGMSRHLKVEPPPVFVPIAERPEESGIGLLGHPRGELAVPARAFLDMVAAMPIAAMVAGTEAVPA